MENKKYYVGLDIGTDSVGYAVTDEAYGLCKYRGEPMWGVTLFDEAETAADRRSHRTARRRLDRRQQRVQLIGDLFAESIGEIDKDFFRRRKESYLYPGNDGEKIRIFETKEATVEYAKRYPTIHHLIVDLMKDPNPHDVRLVYIACAWLVAHRGHFLSEVDKHRVNEVVNFKSIYADLKKHIERDEYSLPWQEDIDLDAVAKALKNKKEKELTAALFGSGKAPKEINERYEINYAEAIKLLCGKKADLKKLFGKEEYAVLQEKSVALNCDEEKLNGVMQEIGDDFTWIAALKKVYDWSILVDILNGNKTISEAKIDVYNQHRNDLAMLKKFTKKYCSEHYRAMFLTKDSAIPNYGSYIGKSANKESFCEYVLKLFKSVTPDNEDSDKFNDMIERLKQYRFLPKQVEGDNRVIPYQLYWFELNEILKNAERYLPFLAKADDDGITGSQKVLSVFEFRIPYYVGPLKEADNPKHNHWMVRKAEGKIYPWNFDEKVDADACENAFIARMTNSCTYLPGEDVLPKNSLIYSSFEVLNEINNLKINGNEIPVSVKQGLYNNLFLRFKNVTPNRIQQALITDGYAEKDDVISGVDVSVKSSLKPYLDFKNLWNSGLLSQSDAENIIRRRTYSEDKTRFSKLLKSEYPNLQEKDLNYLSGLKFKEFGRLSKRFLCEIDGVDKTTGEAYSSILRALWETNCNLMQLLSDRFTFAEKIADIQKEYYSEHPKNVADRLEEMYVSNSVKRPIIRTLDILNDVVKVQKCPPERIFIEMARGATEQQKGRTQTRLDQLQKLYQKIDTEDVRRMEQYLDGFGNEKHSRLQSDKIFLYFLQLGQCMYTGRHIDLESVIAGDGKYNIDHIYPRKFVKDDSILNNKVLVESNANKDKGEEYPIKENVRNQMRSRWDQWHKLNLISDEKYKRLIRNTPFTAEEKFEFINRQLVETRQSTKAVAELLKERYPQSEIVYVKAGLTSDFRNKFELPKSREVNDLHHAKDAYLNIVTGNVWHCKYSRKFWNRDAENNAKPETIFTRPVFCMGKTVWKGTDDLAKVKEIARKNTARLTKYSFCKKGQFFDQNPRPAAQGLIPLKKDRPTEIYGGYNKSAATFFVLVRYKTSKKQDVMIMPVELLHADKFLRDERFAEEYATRTIAAITKNPVESVEFLLNKRILKVNTLLSLNGFKACISGKSGGGTKLLISNLTPFRTSPDREAYLKKLESFREKKKKNENLVFSEKYDGITAEENATLYDEYLEKFRTPPYRFRPNNPIQTLENGRETFLQLSPDTQASILLSIQGLFGRIPTANLTLIKGNPSSGAATLSSSISNWKKYYTDVRIVDQSASGLFEKVSENLLDLL